MLRLKKKTMEEVGSFANLATATKKTAIMARLKSNCETTKFHSFSLYHTVPQIAKIFTMPHPVTRYIQKCINNGVDPRATINFYYTVHRFISLSFEIYPEIERNYDTYWHHYDCRAKDELGPALVNSIKADVRIRVNMRRNPSPSLPLSSDVIGVRGRVMVTLVSRLHESVQWHVLTAATKNISVLDDLLIRAQFFNTWVHYVDENSSDFIDWFWRALCYRRKEFYKKLGIIPPPKRFDLDVLMKHIINSYIQNGSNPRAKHKFYFAIYFCLESGWMNKFSVRHKEQYWIKYDNWAEQAFSTKTPVTIGGEGDKNVRYFTELDRLPLTHNSTLHRKKGLSPNQNMRSAFSTFMLEKVKKIRITSNCKDIENNLQVRRKFFDEYIDWVPGNVQDAELDRYWKKLLSPL